MLELDQAKTLRKAMEGHRVLPNLNLGRMRVISVTSGKGGVGKSSVVANLATILGSRGKKVLLLDGDFGLANLDILFDFKPSATIRDVLVGAKSSTDLVARIAENVDIIPSSSGFLEMTKLGLQDKSRILEILGELDSKYDYLLIDTGAGISDDVVWLNSSASEIVVIITPEPTSIADGYALIKVLHQKHKINDFKLLVNQVKSENEARDVYRHLTSVCDRFLNVSIDFLGHLIWDELNSKSIRMRRPIVAAYPSSKIAKHYSNLADTFLRESEISYETQNVQFFWKALLGHA